MWAKKLLLSVKTYGKLEVPYHTINRLTCLGTPIRICTQYKVECDVTCGLNWRKQTSVAVQDWTNDTSFSHHITGIRMLCTLAQQAFMCRGKLPRTFMRYNLFIASFLQSSSRPFTSDATPKLLDL
jgi:hypothetical protein